MPYVIAPNRVHGSAARIWVGALDEPPAAGPVVLEGVGPPRPVGPWQPWAGAAGQNRLRHAFVDLHDLPPRQRHALTLRVGGQARAQGSVVSLPRELPSAAEKPFTVMLGSCFCEQEEVPRGAVGKAYRAMPPASAPDVKLLCGDQVYLDSPWKRFVLRRHKPAELEQMFLDNYIRTWSQSFPVGGFQELLSAGANFFLSDDHEFWNNAPTAASVISDSWLESTREAWRGLATNLFRTFQSDRDVTTFDVGPLSFCLADTRINRDRERNRLMSDADLGRLQTWVQGLRGPGVLSLTQPIFSHGAGFFGRLTDWSLPDFRQYADIARILLASRRPLLLLTGDVHYGRIAHGRLASGCTLTEVISSPLALVDRRAAGTWSPAPARFPERAAAGLVPIAVETEPGWRPTGAHYLTLEFWSQGPAVQLRVRVWPVGEAGVDAPPGTAVYQTTLD